MIKRGKRRNNQSAQVGGGRVLSNKSFKFPPDPTHSGPAPPVPDIPKDLSAATQQPKSSTGDGESDEVAMVAPSSVEVPPPPPIEKGLTTSTVSDLDDVGETEEISLN